MEILFVAGVTPIVRDPASAQRLYRDTLGLPLRSDTDDADYVAMDGFGGVKHFGVWPLSAAAESCFGTREWPEGLAVPQVTIEFEMADADAVAAGAADLEAQGHVLLHGARTEPWGQVVARMLTADGVLLGLSYAPWMHGDQSAPG